MKIFFTLFLALLFFNCQAQDPSVEKSVYGIQTGLIGVWVNNEYRLSGPFSLRTELGFESSEISYSSTMGWNYTFTPIIKSGPRWYYNLKRRQDRNKKIAKNTGDFLELNLNFAPRQPTLTNYDKSLLGNKIGLAAMWGIRRHAGEHFCFETGLTGGMGYVLYTAEYSSYNGTYYILKIHLRVGYTF